MKPLKLFSLIALCSLLCFGCNGTGGNDYDCVVDSECDGTLVCRNGQCVALTLCGNGQIDPNETCDGDCPTSCDDGDDCTNDTLSGSAASCTAECSYAAVTDCLHDDGCCPEGCALANDNDCANEGFALRLNGGLETGTSEHGGLTFYPLTDYVVTGDVANNSDEALRNDYAIQGTPYPDFYRTETWLPNNNVSSSFSFAVEPGDYTVHLHFVDWAPNIQGVGARVFHVDLQGERVLSDLDIIDEVGKNTVLIKSFNVASSGQIDLTITNVVGYPEIAGVEIVQPAQPYLGQATTLPASPSELNANAASSSSVVLTWTDNADDESLYELQWCLASDDSFSESAALPADSSSYTVTGLEPATAYAFRVAAGNAIGLSAFSNEAQATTHELASVDCAAIEILCVDDNAGAHQEYSTIQSAIDAAGANDTIYVRAGTYPEELTIAKDQLSLSAFPGEERQAVVTGARAVTGWALADAAELNGNPNAAHIYVADAPCQTQRLFQGEGELRASRYPSHSQSGEDRYLHISSVQTARSAFTSSEIGKAEGYFAGARSHVRTAQWRIGARRVTSQSAAGAVVLEGDVSGYDMSPEWGFFFTQVVGEIAANGEWAWRNGKIFLMADAPPGGIEAACRDYAIHVTGEVTDLTIHGLRLTRAAADGIHVDALTNQGLTISDCLIDQCVRNGIKVETGDGSVFINSNEIADCWLGGIDLHSTDAPIVTQNYIHDIGASAYHDDVLTDGSYGECTGILLINGRGALVSENRIERIAYNGIAVIDFGNSGARTISKNYVNEAMLGINDGAGIYFGIFEGDPTAKEMISDNIVENCIGGFLGTKPSSGYYPQGVGIYSDDGAEYIDILRNVMSKNAINLFLHDSAHNDMDGNIIYGATRKNVYLTSQRDYCLEGDPTPRHNTMTNNILFSVHDSNPELQLRTNYPECSILDSSDYNAFHGAGSTEYIIHQWSTPDTKNYYDLPGWQAASTYEDNSVTLPVCADSLIVLNPSPTSLSCTNLTGCVDETGLSTENDLQIPPFSAQIFCACAQQPSCVP